jgi:hypothetical protein
MSGSVDQFEFIVKGHDFNRAANGQEHELRKGSALAVPPKDSNSASGAHEVSGHDLPGSPATGLRRWGGFSRAAKAQK